MFERFTKDARHVVDDAVEQARRSGSPTIEAEHLLLSLAAGTGPAARVLHGSGLTLSRTRAAIDEHFERTLATIGVSPGAFALPPPALNPRPRFGASFKLALERALKTAMERNDRRIGAEHVLLGVLRAEAGTVPRLLAAEGIDRDELAARVGAQRTAY